MPGAALQPDLDGAGGAVVPVRDIQAVDPGEGGGQRGDIGVAVDHPDGVDDAVRRCEIVFRRFCGVFRQDRVHGLFPAVGQEDRPGVRVAGVDVADAVRLLVRAGLLVLFDDVVQIIVDADAADKPRLGAAVHDLAINIQHGFRLMQHIAAVGERLQVRGGLRVDRVAVKVGLGRQIDLRLIDVDEAEGRVFDQLARLLTVHDVVGQRGDLRGIFRLRPDGGKRAQDGHDTSSFLCFAESG